MYAIRSYYEECYNDALYYRDQIREMFNHGRITLRVITSYSIHYTKLYEEYETMSLILTNLTDGWILENPTADEVSENMLDEYYDQIDAWNVV